MVQARTSFFRIFGALFFLMSFLMNDNVNASNTGDRYKGYKLVEKRFVKEVDAECYYYIHEQSGARVFKIAAKDPNKTFCIAFKTFPESDAGTPHILEHSVLNGSKNFPVKSPFDVLMQGSLKTFINAFTGKDMTAYPVASMNDKDYFNLMHVYLDAVFNPLIYSDNRIMDQEGWHYEIAMPEDPILYKGVVYNEMKGAYSSPTRELSYRMYRNLFPGNPYGFESGGYPPSIPTLTHEQFKEFHTRYYHPENSYILLYGDAELSKELAFLDSEYLSKYTRANNLPVVIEQKPFPSRKELKAYYPVLEDADTNHQTYLALGYISGKGTDMKLSMGLDILMEVLVNQESAPIRLALQEAGIGQDVNAYVNSYLQNVIQITVQKANTTDSEKFMEVVMKTLKEQAEKGIDRKAVEGVLNRTEFQLREGNDAQKGLTAAFQIVGGWFHTDDPFLGLEWEKPLAALKKGIPENYLESLIRTYLLDNPHCLLLTLEPKRGLEKEINALTEAQLKAFKEDLSSDSIQALIHHTEVLIAYQKQEDTPEALASIPLLERSDINPKAEYYAVKEEESGTVPVLRFNTFTNGVVYVNLLFDLRTIPQEMIPYASLLSNVLSLLNTKNYTYGDLNTELNIHTGGFYTSMKTYLGKMDDRNLIPKFAVTSKAMPEKLDKMFSLTTEILNHTMYQDQERLRAVLTRHQAQLDASMKRDGYPVASRRLSSYYSNQGMFNELTSGLEYYWFITDLSKNFDQKASGIMENLFKVATLLFDRDNLIVSITCSEKESEASARALTGFLATLPQNGVKTGSWVFKLEKNDEGIRTTSKVQYVVQGFNYKNLGFAWDGRMRVLNQILSTDYLQTRIRVIGGAYGGFSSINPSGFMSFNSYRDPNLKETLNNYDSIPSFLRTFDADEKEMTRFIIGTIAGIDTPLTPSSKGDQAVNYYFTRRTAEEVQHDRDMVITTTAGDIRGFEKLTQAVLNQKAYCVYGNANKIEQEKDLFKTLLKIEKQ